MTDLELNLMRDIVELTMPEIRYAFEPVVAIEPEIIGQESNPQFAQLAAPTDMVIVVSFEIKIEAVTDVMTLCIPFSSLQPHLEALSASTRTGNQSAEKLAAQQQRLNDHLSDASVDAAAVFRPLIGASSQIVALDVGDLILLNHPVALPLTVEVGGVATHDVRIGRVNRHAAIQVVGRVPADRNRRPSRMKVIRDRDVDA